MPIYEYACRHCGLKFEKLVRAGALPQCPQCQSAELDKQLSVFGTASSTPATPAMASPCGACGHPDGPGSCAVR